MDPVVEAAPALDLVRTGPDGGFVTWATLGEVDDDLVVAWASGDLEPLTPTRVDVGPGAQRGPQVATDGRGRLLLVWWEPDGLRSLRGKVRGHDVRWERRPHALGPGFAPRVGFDGARFRVAAQRDGDVVHLDPLSGEVLASEPGELLDLQCRDTCAWTVSQDHVTRLVTDAGATELGRYRPRLVMAPEGPWILGSGFLRTAAGEERSGYRTLRQPVAAEVRGELVDAWVAEDGGLFRLQLDGNQWRTFGHGLPGEPAEGVVVDRELTAWWACPGAGFVRSGVSTRVTDAGWDAEAVVHAASGAGVVAVGVVDGGGVRLEGVHRGPLHAGDWLAVTTERPAGERVVVITAPGRLTLDKWSVLALDALPRVEAQLARGTGPCRASLTSR
jgi:hypothetical protein